MEGANHKDESNLMNKDEIILFQHSNKLRLILYPLILLNTIGFVFLLTIRNITDYHWSYICTLIVWPIFLIILLIYWDTNMYTFKITHFGFYLPTYKSLIGKSVFIPLKDIRAIRIWRAKHGFTVYTFHHGDAYPVGFTTSDWRKVNRIFDKLSLHNKIKYGELYEKRRRFFY